VKERLESLGDKVIYYGLKESEEQWVDSSTESVTDTRENHAGESLDESPSNTVAVGEYEAQRTRDLMVQQHVEVLRQLKKQNPATNPDSSGIISAINSLRSDIRRMSEGLFSRR
jgi:hypothetical protein